MQCTSPSVVCQETEERPAIDVEKRAARALSRQGKLSSARMALEGAEVPPGNLDTLLELTNPEKRPPRPRRDLSQEVVHNESAVPCVGRGRISGLSSHSTQESSSRALWHDN